jgi:hypothetical protein
VALNSGGQRALLEDIDMNLELKEVDAEFPIGNIFF